MSDSNHSSSAADMSEMLQAELDGEFSGAGRKADRPVTIAGGDKLLGQSERLPQKIAGGFLGLSEDLHTRALEWRTVHRLLEQQRPQLELASQERDRLLQELDRTVSRAQETSGQLADSIAAAHDGDLSGDLAQRFARNLAALDELEAVAGSLSGNLLAIRSAWEQYARTAIRAHKLREELKTI